MKKVLKYCLIAVLSLAFMPMSGQTVTVVPSDDIPGGLSKSSSIKLTGEWGTSEFQELAVSLGTTSFGAQNKNLTEVDMSEARIKPATSLCVSGGFSKNGVFVNCKALSKVIMPVAAEAANFTDLTQAFMNSDKLSEIDLSNCSGLTLLKNAFFGCASLKAVDLSASTQLTLFSSMTSAFDGCSALESVVLPNNILFAEETFSNCTSLKKIDWKNFNGTEAPVYYSTMFNGISDLKQIHLVVPQNKLELFTADPKWSKLSIEGFHSTDVDDVVQDFFNLNGGVLTTGTAARVLIFDMSGRMVYSGIVDGQMNLNTFGKGLYVLVCNNGKHSVTCKVRI